MVPNVSLSFTTSSEVGRRHSDLGLVYKCLLRGPVVGGVKELEGKCV